jgi:hypothetical protein
MDFHTPGLIDQSKREQLRVAGKNYRVVEVYERSSDFWAQLIRSHENTAGMATVRNSERLRISGSETSAKDDQN